jgi:hypothetical protein
MRDDRDELVGKLVAAEALLRLYHKRGRSEGDDSE